MNIFTRKNNSIFIRILVDYEDWVKHDFWQILIATSHDNSRSFLYLVSVRIIAFARVATQSVLLLLPDVFCCAGIH